MPTYTYRCSECDHEFEARQRMTDDPLEVCPVCEGRVRRVVNSVGIVFKGSGFYVTDNRNGSSKPAESIKSPSKETDKAEKKETPDASPKKDSTKAEKTTAAA